MIACARLSACALSIMCLGGVSACGEDEPIGPAERGIDLAGKPAPSGDPTVAATEPTEAAQDTTLDVRVLGSNFDRGSRAELALNCEVECVLSEKVKTNSTRYVSSGELVANITIAVDADVDLYDVLVTTSKGKRGIGIELFAVKVGHPNPQTGYTELTLDRLPGATTCEGVALSEDSDVIGFCDFRKGDRRGFFWSASGGMVDLGIGYPEDVSDFGGPIVVGRSGPSATRVAAVWQTNGSALDLPQFPTDGCPGGGAYGVNGAGDLVAGSACLVVGGGTRSLPVTWTREGSGWSDPQPLPLPAGYNRGIATSMSTNGVILGFLQLEVPATGGNHYFVWFPPYLTAERVPPASLILAYSVNDAGDVSGSGTSTAVPGGRSLFLKRNGAGWDLPFDLGRGSAQGINNSGQVTGGAGNEVYVWSAASGTLNLDQGIGYGINDRGDIAGTYLMNERAVLWVAP